jgi:hypothetical protein
MQGDWERRFLRGQGSFRGRSTRRFGSGNHGEEFRRGGRVQSDLCLRLRLYVRRYCFCRQGRRRISWRLFRGGLRECDSPENRGKIRRLVLHHGRRFIGPSPGTANSGTGSGATDGARGARTLGNDASNCSANFATMEIKSMRFKRLLDDSVRSHLRAARIVVRLHIAGDEQHRHVRKLRRLFHKLANFIAISARHGNVSKNDNRMEHRQAA